MYPHLQVTHSPKVFFGQRVKCLCLNATFGGTHTDILTGVQQLLDCNLHADLNIWILQ